MSSSSPSSDTPNRKPAHQLDAPDITVSAREVFNLDIDMDIPAFSSGSEYVPDRDDSYIFDHDTTLAILAGLPITAASWCKAIMAPENPPISNRSRPD
jgi:cobaltochelatase CobS